MKHCTLTRFAQLHFATFGKMQIDDLMLYTVERPWKNNEAFVSCVPIGQYICHWRPTTTSVPGVFSGSTWYLEGHTVSIDRSTKDRCRVAIHAANRGSELGGCIAPGLRLGFLKDEWCVSNSNQALTAMLDKIGKQSFELLITRDKTDYISYGVNL